MSRGQTPEKGIDPNAMETDPLKMMKVYTKISKLCYNITAMKILGEPLFAKNPDGTLKSRVGTLFFRTPGLVTERGVHAMQRIAWTRELNRLRVEEGRPELTESEAMAEWADSVDLLFLDDSVLIRPDPKRLDLAFKADDVLQTLVSKRKIRFLNTHTAAVRDALRARGENWRMARAPQSPEEIVKLLESARVAISNETVYYYNPHTGTRWLTAGSYERVCALSATAFREQITEIVSGLSKMNRLGQPEIALFPTKMSADVVEAFRRINPEELDDASLRAAVASVEQKWRMALPSSLREEDAANFEWRAEMSATLSHVPNATEVGDQDLIQGISPEFYRQIEWLPGGRIEKGELLFDPIWDESQRTQDPELLEFCDFRVRSILFNVLRLFGDIEYINIGRISRSLARRPVAGSRRGNVYIVQCKEVGAEPTVHIIRFQKWGIAEHLDEGKDLLRSILEANEYSDYILDRRLACRQLGMNLPRRLGFGQFTEKYSGRNQYAGTTVRAYYYVRDYEAGIASDKVPPERFRNPAFAQAFAYLMGQAAAVDLVVGRAATETGESLFDSFHEVLKCGPDGLPKELVVTDHAGSFVKYREDFEELVPAYARVVLRREKFVDDFASFAKTYVLAFERKLTEIQTAYRSRRTAFDDLFLHRPYDEAGSGAFRWSCILRRLDACNPQAVAEMLKKAIQS